MADLITYEMLYEILREEKIKKDLVKLDENFFKNVINYITEKQNVLESQQKKETVKVKKQLENIQRILRELYERRETKIIQLALFQSRTNEVIDMAPMLAIEKGFFNDLLASLNCYRSAILINLLENKEPKLEEKQEPKGLKSQNEQVGVKLVKILNAVPKFVGDDLHVYGPFEEEYIASLPVMVADVLVKKNKAEYII